ncbi:MAG: GatB/YqeY domain-containing protein [Acidiferrobacterales bacterium]|nr:GatB/YqeY domain-containing protein [Acidiferrobacterales bacterium]
MSELKKKLMDDMKIAMRDKSTIDLETIRMMRAAVQRKEVDDRTELDDAGVLQIVQKLVKQCTDAEKQFIEGNRQDLADKERANIEVMERYLPEKLSDDEVDQLIKEAIAESGASSMKDMGKVMGLLKNRIQGRADMGALSGKIKGLLG